MRRRSLFGSPLDNARVLKQGDTFAVFDRAGDIAEPSHGLFYDGTRFISLLELDLGDVRPMLLNSSVLQDDILFIAHLTNPDLLSDHEAKIPRGTLHLFRSRFLLDGACFERIRLSNFGDKSVAVPLSLALEGDFADIFQVRGILRSRHGQSAPPKWTPSAFELRYQGLDDIVRRLRLSWCAPRRWRMRQNRRRLQWKATLAPRETATFDLRSSCDVGRKAPPDLSYERALERAIRERGRLSPGECRIESSNAQFNAWLSRSYADVHMMTHRLRDGLYPYAGVPWFNAIFGRDGLWTALFYLWIAPELARGVLAHLAAHQARSVDASRDAEPGKILHESRGGEMAALREIPFDRYYGAVDSTPLFVILAGAYLDRTGDLPFATTIWPAVERALVWLERWGDFDGDGFVEYARRSKDGLSNQGWKDSRDAVFHRNGDFARGPIALCEVQGYAFAALRSAGRMALRLGKPKQAGEYAAKASQLRKRFERAFWSDELGFYAMALDGDKKRCLVRSSNAGQLLYCGIVGQERARRVARQLLGPDFFTGWGIRTIARDEARFNPLSYHNGSVWPHDNAIIAQGLADYGRRTMTLRVLEGLFEASTFMDLDRLPELFCGFERRPMEGPTLYPGVCSPQAWASAAPFMLIQAALGLKIDGFRRSISFQHPALPAMVPDLRLRGLSVGSGRADVLLTRGQRDVGVRITRRSGPLKVRLVK